MSDKEYCGLTSDEVEERRAKYGANVLTPPEKTSLWVRFLEKFKDPIIIILLVALVLSFAISCFHCFGPEKQGFQAFLEPIGILVAVLMATIIGFVFEVKASNAFDKLNAVNDEVDVTVIRDGAVHQIPRRDVVVDDIVLLNTGDEVPADGILLEANSLQINESTLTGEPVISKTTVVDDFDDEATYPSNKAMRSTTVVEGNGVMRVETVGDATEYGKVNTGSLIENNLETPLQVQLKRLAGVISKVGYTVAIITFLLLSVKGLWNWSEMSLVDIGSEILSNFMIAVTLIVVSVPEGLPMSVTLSLALSMNRMLKTNNLVRKMHACETMGAATVICTDKTGTLTQNRMQVYEADFFALKNDGSPDDTQKILINEGIAVNSTANLDKASDGTIKTIGNPTEAALLLWLDKQGVDYNTLRSEAKLLSVLTFSTERKYMATVVSSSLLGKKVLYVKGAPEIILSRCSKVVSVNGLTNVDERRNEIEAQLLEYQNKAMRTLGFAYCILDDDDNDAPYENGRLTDGLPLIYLGIVAISDPVRADVPKAVQTCLKAGIDVKIVTGDTQGTASEIGRQIGIIKQDTPADCIITGPAFEALSDEEAAKRVMSLKIMCRARPMDKQRLVNLLQQQGAVVAVTGDGTNDAPALKAAQVGLSMGDGTSVAKEASDITILDNSFGSITRAVMWGRSLYKNIQRFLLFQLTINVAACFIVMLGSLLGTSSPLTITQMLWVNLIMDTFASCALASLAPSWSVMKELPRKNSDFIVTHGMAYAIFSVAACFVAALMAILYHYHADGGMTLHRMSWFFTFFVMLQWWNLFNAKSFMTGASAFKGIHKERLFMFIALLIFIGQVLIVTYGGKMFSVEPLTVKDWVTITLMTSPVLLVGEFIAIFRGRNRQ